MLEEDSEKMWPPRDARTDLGQPPSSVPLPTVSTWELFQGRSLEMVVSVETIWSIPWRRDRLPTPVFLGLPGGSDGKESTCNAQNLGLIPVLGRSPEGGHSNPLQYSCLENPHGQQSLGGYSPWSQRVVHD